MNNNVQLFVKTFIWWFIFLSYLIFISLLEKRDKFSRKKNFHIHIGHLCPRNNRVRLLRGIQFAGITADRSERFDIPFGCDGNSPESKKNQIYKVNEIGRYALYHRRTVFLVSRNSSFKDAANIANIIPFFRVINELRFFLLRWESKHANNRIQSEIRAFYERKILRNYDNHRLSNDIC